ncbi:MAG: RNA methyltransferase [Deltaproteobacteria bacterium]|nr:RNA methyltransferase [Deltaproteobacteria bacterium]
MKIKRMTSPYNPTVKIFSRLTHARGIKKYGMALFSGPKQVREILQEFSDRVAGVIFSDRQEPPAGPATEEIPYYHLSPELFNRIDPFDIGQPILLVRVDPFPEWTGEAWPTGCTLCIPFQDPANVGAAIRSAAAFGVSGVIILKEAAHPFLPKSVRAAGSALFRVPLFQGPSLDRLEVSDAPMITLSPGGHDIKGYRFPDSFCLVPGLEGPGLPKQLRDARALSIPMEPCVESLNAALATGIALYQWRSFVR